MNDKDKIMATAQYLEDRCGKLIVLEDLEKRSKLKKKNFDNALKSLIEDSTLIQIKKGFVQRSDFNNKAKIEEQNRLENLLKIAKEYFSKNKIKYSKNNVYYLNLKSISKELFSEIINNPEETLQILELALEESFGYKCPRIRLINIPKILEIKIRDVRAKHINKLISFEGYIVQVSAVRPQVIEARFECPSCGTVISVLQIEKKFREPSRCACGRKGKFRLINKDMIDAQRIVVAEGRKLDDEGLALAPSISVFLKEDLTDPDKRILEGIGKKIKVVGILKEVPQPLQTGGQSTRFDLAIETNNIIGK